MDIMGKKPTTERGKYFRNNLWWWRPLWDYCSDLAQDLIDDELYMSGHHNDGAGLDADGATTLGNRLLAELESGRTAEFEAEYRERVASLEMQACELCNGGGIRFDKIGMEQGMHDKALEEEVAIVVGRTHGWCNGCRGLGKTPHWGTNYPFDVRNVEEFARFCVESGGFEIW